MDKSKKERILIYVLVGSGLILVTYFMYMALSLQQQDFILESTKHLGQVGTRDTTLSVLPPAPSYVRGQTIDGKAINAALDYYHNLHQVASRIDKTKFYQDFAKNQFTHQHENTDDTFVRQLYE